MRKPPRGREERIFGRRELSLAIFQGAVLLASVFAFYAWLASGVTDEQIARAAAFVALITGHLSLALAEKTSSGASIFARSQIVFWSIAAGATLIVSAALSIPFLQDILRFAPPPAPILALSLMVGLLSGGWYAAAPFIKRGHEQLRPSVGRSVPGRG